jgi:hypothetical protein
MSLTDIKIVYKEQKESLQGVARGCQTSSWQFKRILLEILCYDIPHNDAGS